MFDKKEQEIIKKYRSKTTYNWLSSICFNQLPKFRLMNINSVFFTLLMLAYYYEDYLENQTKLNLLFIFNCISLIFSIMSKSIYPFDLIITNIINIFNIFITLFITINVYGLNTPIMYWYLTHILGIISIFIIYCDFKKYNLLTDIVLFRFLVSFSWIYNFEIDTNYNKNYKEFFILFISIMISLLIIISLFKTRINKVYIVMIIYGLYILKFNIDNNLDNLDNEYIENRVLGDLLIFFVLISEIFIRLIILNSPINIYLILLSYLFFTNYYLLVTIVIIYLSVLLKNIYFY